MPIKKKKIEKYFVLLGSCGNVCYQPNLYYGMIYPEAKHYDSVILLYIGRYNNIIFYVWARYTSLFFPNSKKLHNVPPYK